MGAGSPEPAVKGDFFLDETYLFFFATSGQPVTASIQDRYTLTGPGPGGFHAGSWAPLTCPGPGSGTFCDSGPVEVVRPELETGPLAAGRYTFTLESVMTATVVPEPRTALLMAAGLALVGFGRRRSH